MSANLVELRETLASELLEARRALQRAMAGELVLLERIETLNGAELAALGDVSREHAASHLALVTASERLGELLSAAVAVQQTPQAQA